MPSNDLNCVVNGMGASPEVESESGYIDRENQQFGI